MSTQSAPARESLGRLDASSFAARMVARFSGSALDPQSASGDQVQVAVEVVRQRRQKPQARVAGEELCLTYGNYGNYSALLRHCDNLENDKIGGEIIKNFLIKELHFQVR